MKKNLLSLIENKKTLSGLLIFIFCSASYLYTNYLTTSMNPRELPLFMIDHLIPFFPRSIWIYLSAAIICIVAFYCAKDVRNVTRYLLSLVTITVIALFFYILFPTIFPRFPFPTPPDLDQWTMALLNWLRRIDYPTNCLPSLHVSYSFSACFVFLQEQKSKFPFFLIWACLIALSTLTTKQHYFLDVVTGLVFAYLTYRLFLYLFPNYLPNQ